MPSLYTTTGLLSTILSLFSPLGFDLGRIHEAALMDVGARHDHLPAVLGAEVLGQVADQEAHVLAERQELAAVDADRQIAGLGPRPAAVGCRGRVRRVAAGRAGRARHTMAGEVAAVLSVAGHDATYPSL